jgi:hypothetical protein
MGEKKWGQTFSLNICARTYREKTGRNNSSNRGREQREINHHIFIISNRDVKRRNARAEKEKEGKRRKGTKGKTHKGKESKRRNGKESKRHKGKERNGELLSFPRVSCFPVFSLSSLAFPVLSSLVFLSFASLAFLSVA